MEYRPLPDDRYQQFQEYLRYAFSPEEGPRGEYDTDPDDQPGAPRALFDGDQMLCVCRHNWFRTSLRGERIEMPGLSAVASPPEHRRAGNVARMLADSLAEYRDRGDAVTALWAFSHPFYERQGWGLANKWVRYECPPDALAFAREAAAGEFRPMDADDFERLDPVHAAATEPYDLVPERTETWWRKRVFEGWGTDPYVYAWVDDEGDARGYVVYNVVDEDDGKRLHADEVAAADREAHLNLLRFLANHDSQVDTVSMYRPPDASLLDSVTDPMDVDCEVKPGPMVRLVDVERAVETLTYPSDLDAAFALAVADPLVDWNDRVFRVAVADGRATCEPAAIDEADADVAASVSALSQVYAGYHSVGDAETYGEFDVRDAAARVALDAMFPERDVVVWENF